MKRVLYWAGHRVPNRDRLPENAMDVVVIDLEEAVPPELLGASRDHLAASCAVFADLVPFVLVRTNSPPTLEGRVDCQAIVDLPENIGICFPKPLSVDAISIGRELAGDHRTVWIMGEEPNFVTQLPRYVAAHSAIEAVIVGGKDLAESLALPVDFADPELRDEMLGILVAGKAVGLSVFDAVAAGDPPAVEQAVKRAQLEGFDGVTLLRPFTAPPSLIASDGGSK